MLNTVQRMVDVLFPPRESELLVRTFTTTFQEKDVGFGVFRDVAYLFDYTDPRIRAVVHENKYHGNMTAARLLASALHLHLQKISETAVLCSVPLSRNRYRERGYNQVEQVLTLLRDNYHIIDPLKKHRDTPSQTTLPKEKRLTNPHGAFSCDAKTVAELSDRMVYIIDDVVTTGATLHEARATLAPHVPPSTKIKLLAFAH